MTVSEYKASAMSNVHWMKNNIMLGNKCASEDRMDQAERYWQTAGYDWADALADYDTAEQLLAKERKTNG